MTLKEFERAIFRNNGHVISVKKHKTGYKGPAHGLQQGFIQGTDHFQELFSK